MAKKVPWARRIGYITAILFFIILAPLLIYYVQGYRYNSYKQKIEPKGILIVETTPKGAQVSIDGQKIDSTTPLERNDLRPGNYELSLDLAGYFEWKKNIAIKAQETTIINKISLIRNDSPWQNLNNIPTNISTALENKDKTSIAFISEDAKNKLPNLVIYDVKNNKFNIIYNFKTKFNDAPLEPISWSPDNKFLLLKQKVNGQNHYLIVNTKKQQSLINLAWPQPTNDTQWTANGQGLILSDKKQLTLINTTNGQREVLLNKGADSLISYYFNKENFSNDIYYLEQNINNKSFSISKIDINNKKIQLITNNLNDLNTDYKFAGIINEKILLLNNKKQIMQMVPLTTDKNNYLTEEQIIGIKDFIIDDGKNEIFYYNDLELWHYDLSAQTKKLITRYGNEIKKIQQHSNQYLLVQHGDSLDLVDWDNIENQWQITQINDSNDSWVWQSPELSIFTKTPETTTVKTKKLSTD